MCKKLCWTHGRTLPILSGMSRVHILFFRHDVWWTSMSTEPCVVWWRQEMRVFIKHVLNNQLLWYALFKTTIIYHYTLCTIWIYFYKLSKFRTINRKQLFAKYHLKNSVTFFTCLTYLRFQSFLNVSFQVCKF